MTRPPRLPLAAAALVAVLIAGCVAQTPGGSADPISTQSSTAPDLGGAAGTAQTGSDGEVVPDLDVFITAIDAALVDTPYADAAFEDPEVFIATGQLFCEWAADGAGDDEILGTYLDHLSDSPTRADAMLAGVVLGASREIICPEAVLSNT